MLKVRYSRLRISRSIESFASLCRKWRSSDSSRLKVTKVSERDVVLNYTSVRYITVTEILDDGTEVKKPIATMEQHSFRIFKGAVDMYLSVLNPGRGTKLVEKLLEEVLGAEQYFLEPLEISTALIDLHVSRFAVAKLVSAKLRDFRVYESAVGRLEITSKAGLPTEIAPFLEGKFYRMDSLTYEVTDNFVQGLICYSSGGSVRVSGPLVDVAFPLFESGL